MSVSNDIEEINRFLRRLHNGEFDFIPLKQQAEVELGEGEQKKSYPLTIYLDKLLDDFEGCEDETKKRKIARSCKGTLRQMWLGGVIHEGNGLNRKIDELQSENDQLRVELAIVSNNLNRKIKQLQALEKTFNIKSKDDFREGGK